MVIAATNRPDLVDPALLRPGRFDRLLHVPRPDAAGRAAMLAVLARRTPLVPDVDLQVCPSKVLRKHLHAIVQTQCTKNSSAPGCTGIMGMCVAWGASMPECPGLQ